MPKCVGAAGRDAYRLGRHNHIHDFHQASGHDAYVQERDDGEKVVQLRCPVLVQKVLTDHKSFGKNHEFVAEREPGVLAPKVISNLSNLVQPMYDNTLFEMPEGEAYTKRRQSVSSSFAVTDDKVAAFVREAEAAVGLLHCEGYSSGSDNEATGGEGSTNNGGARGGRGEAGTAGSATLVAEVQHWVHRLLRRFVMHVACGEAVTNTKEEEGVLDEVLAYSVERYREPATGPTGPRGHAVTEEDRTTMTRMLGVAQSCVGRLKAADEAGECPALNRTLLGSLLPLDIDDDELAETLVCTLVAGAESPSGMLSWLLRDLSTHPEVQQRCADEAARVREAHGGISTAKAMNAMAYIEAAAKETLRLHTPATIVHRTANKDVDLGANRKGERGAKQVPVAQGQKVGICMHAVHMNEKVWPQPELYRPERHMPDGGVADRDKFAYMPFTGGKRGCPGAPLTYCWAKVVVAAVLERYELLPADNEFYENGKFVTWQADGMKVKLRRRGSAPAAAA